MSNNNIIRPFNYMSNSIISVLITLMILGLYGLIVKSWQKRGNFTLTIRKRVLSR